MATATGLLPITFAQMIQPTRPIFSPQMNETPAPIAQPRQ